MPQWNPVAGWMEFPYLSVSAGITKSFTLGYRLTDNGAELWTERFNRFKRSDRGAVWGATFVLYQAVPALLGALSLEGKRAVFIPALSSGETEADSQRTIPLMAKWISEKAGASYRLDALSKNSHGKLHNIYTAEARDAELDKAEYEADKLEQTEVFVLDDFITRGATLSRIALAVLKANPKARVYGVALAKTERVDWCPNPQNDHVPEKWNKLWQEGEAAEAEKGNS